MNTGLGLGQPLSGLSQLRRTGAALETFQQQLSSGLRIPTAAVDAAAAGVVVEVEAIAASERVAVRNANDGLSLVQTAEGATGSITDNLQRMRELAVQSASGTLNDDQRASIDAEFQQLSDEIGRQARSTEFNGRNLTDGSSADFDVQVGPDDAADSRIGLALGDLTDTSLGIDALSAGTQGGALDALDALDAALDTVSGQRTEIGSTFSRLESSIRYGEESALQQEAAASRIADVDLAKLVSESAGTQIQQQANIAAQVQSRNIQRTAVLGLLT